MTTTHVIGAGLAGLAAALRLAESGRDVKLYEMGAQAGGRARSYADKALGRRLDNGNHLLLAVNHAALDFVRRVSAEDALIRLEAPIFPFLDVRTGARWRVAPGRGPLPFWIGDKTRRTPGTGLRDHLRLTRLIGANPKASVADVLGGEGEFARSFLEPFVIAVLNASLEDAAARPMGAVLKEILLGGGRAFTPVIAKDGLSEAFAHPTLKRLEALGASLRFGARLTGIEREAGRASALVFGGEKTALGEQDQAVLAVPPQRAKELLPDLTVPEGASAILNLHYRLDAPPQPGWGAPLIGLIGGAAHWLFARGDVVSVTVSAADALIDGPQAALASRIWPEVRMALGLPEGTEEPPCRVVKEKRATFLQTPENMARRPGTRGSGIANVLLAGDWTDTGLPATIEGAIRSGDVAARAALNP